MKFLLHHNLRWIKIQYKQNNDGEKGHIYLRIMGYVFSFGPQLFLFGVSFISCSICRKFNYSQCGTYENIEPLSFLL